MFKFNFKNYWLIQRYINHNKKNFGKANQNKIFLVEFNKWEYIHILFSYLSNFFSSKKNCKIIAYEAYSLFSQKNENFLQKIKWNIGKFFKIKFFGVYASFGTQDFVKPNYSNIIKSKSKKICKKFYSRSTKLKNLEELCVENIWIGDLIYDSYLKRNSTHTIDLKSQDFSNYFFKCICNFYFWLEYFKINKVGGVAACHGVYVSAIPMRIANYQKIPSFYCTNLNIIQPTNKISHKIKCSGVDIQYKTFRKKFQSFNHLHQKKFLTLGKKYLNQIIKGKKKYSYLKNSSFLNKKNNFKFLKNKKIKVIIYPHLFSDSPHVYGNHFFSDFYQWFEFLKIIINKTNYDWYIKRHPREDKQTGIIINNFLKKCPNLKNIPKDISNLFIGKNKIDFALTVYGTIASELPAYGVKVINASKHNPHIDYNFSINPKNLNEYKKYLLNLSKVKVKFKINKKDLFEYHFMKNFYTNNDNYIFSNLDEYNKFKNNRQINITHKCYEIWMKNFSQAKHINIKSGLENFINSNDYMLLPNHFKKFNK